MNHYNSIENKYSSCGLANNRLNNLEDLDRVHNIDITQIPGFKDLGDLHKQIFTRFIVNYYNAQGLEVRESLQPTGIYYVDDISFFVQEEGYLAEARREIYKILTNRKREILHKYENKEYKGAAVLKTTSKNYLRFEFKMQNQPVWLHVKGEDSWY